MPRRSGGDERNRGKEGFGKTHRAYLLTLWYSGSDKASSVVLQASQSNQVQRFPDLASAFAYIEAEDKPP